MMRPCALLSLILLANCPQILSGQTVDRNSASDTTSLFTSPRSVLLSLKGGVVFTSPRQVFPSVRVGESTKGTGAISSRDQGESGTGSRIGVELMAPVGDRLGIVADVASLIWSARLAATPSTLPVRLDVQSLTVGLGLQGNIYTGQGRFDYGTGIGSVYAGGKIDVCLATFSNRIEAYVYPDSSDIPVRAVGSFENSDPFRNLTSFVAQAGARYGLGNIELNGELSYAFALNSVFSSLVVVDNEFTVNNLILQVGIGYRW